MKSLIKKDDVIIKDKLTELQQDKSHSLMYVPKKGTITEILLKCYIQSLGKTKKKILNCVVAGKSGFG